MNLISLKRLSNENPILLPGVVVITVILIFYLLTALADFHTAQKQGWEAAREKQSMLQSLQPIAYWNQQRVLEQEKLDMHAGRCYQADSLAQAVVALRKDLDGLGDELGFKRLSITLSDPDVNESDARFASYLVEMSALGGAVETRMDLWHALEAHMPAFQINELNLALKATSAMLAQFSMCVYVASQGAD